MDDPGDPQRGAARRQGRAGFRELPPTALRGTSAAPSTGTLGRCRALAAAVLIVASAASAACAADTADADAESGDPSDPSGGGEPARADDEVTAKERCAGVRASRTVPVKVMTLNLRHDADQWRRRLELIADEIVRLDPDVIGFQEVQISARQADVLNDRLEARGHARYRTSQHRNSGFIGRFLSGEGLAIMSRWPIVKADYVDTGHTHVTILARVEHPAGGRFDVLDTHLNAGRDEAAERTRTSQAKKTIALADENDACLATVLTGDMNETERAESVKTFFAAGFVDSYGRVGTGKEPGGGRTAMIVLAEGAFAQKPSRRIDFVLARDAGGRVATPKSSVVCFANHDAAGFYPSDHLGVMTTYEIGL